MLVYCKTLFFIEWAWDLYLSFTCVLTGYEIKKIDVWTYFQSFTKHIFETVIVFVKKFNWKKKKLKQLQNRWVFCKLEKFRRVLDK